MINKPSRRGRKFRMALSFPLIIDIRLKAKPTSPRAAIENVGNGIPAGRILSEIKRIKAIPKPMDHFPDAVFGHRLIFILFISFLYI